MAPGLKREREPAGAGTDVEDATSDEIEGVDVGIGPCVRPCTRLEEVDGPIHGIDEAIIPFDDVSAGLSGEGVEQCRPKRIAGLGLH